MTNFKNIINKNINKFVIKNLQKNKVIAEYNQTVSAWARNKIIRAYIKLIKDYASIVNEFFKIGSGNSVFTISQSGGVTIFQFSIDANLPGGPVGKYCKSYYSFSNTEFLNTYEEFDPVEIEAPEGSFFIIGNSGKKSNKIKIKKQASLDSTRKKIYIRAFVELVSPEIFNNPLGQQVGFVPVPPIYILPNLTIDDNPNIEAQTLEDYIKQLKEKIDNLRRQINEELTKEDVIESLSELAEGVNKQTENISDNIVVLQDLEYTYAQVSQYIYSKGLAGDWLIELWDRTTYNSWQTGLGLGGTGSGINCTNGITALAEAVMAALNSEIRNKPCNTITDEFLFNRWKELAEEIVRTPRFMDWTDCD
jgi:hypothetical protein